MPVAAHTYEGPECPRCHARLTADWLHSGTIICPDCNKTFEATAFKPPVQQLEVLSVAAAITPEGANACANHSRNAAVAACSRCGLYICSLCNMDIGSGAYCPSCFDRLRSENALQTAATRYRDYAAMARVSMFAGIFLSFMFLGIPFGALSIYYGRKGFKQLREEGRSAVGLWIVLIIAALEILGGVIMILFIAGSLVMGKK